MPAPAVPATFGRYTLFDAIGEGATAVVHVASIASAGGFKRHLAVKRLLPTLARDPVVRGLFLDEARLAARVVHANVVQTLDVLDESGEALIVMEYVHGESVRRLFDAARARGERASPAVASSIVAGMLRGLHAAHEARGADGRPLGLVHRDVSPDNVLVGVDGVARVLDFGIAKAAGRSALTREGRIKGKLAYMAPEQLMGEPLTQRADIWSAAVVLWELSTGAPLFAGDSDAAIQAKILNRVVPPPTEVVPELPVALNRVVLRALASDPDARFATALEMAEALEASVPPASPSVVGAWVRTVAAPALGARERLLERVDAHHPPRARAGGRRHVVVFGAFGAAVAALAVWSAARPATHAPAAPSPASVTPPAVASASVAPAEPRNDAPAQSASISPSPVAPPMRPPPPERSSPAPHPAPAASSPPVRNCDPPYIADDAGRLRFKRECLE